MSFLIPLGFLGLLGLVVLILIYIIKPNYQQKLVSSTFVWKLSLKYQRKRIPISKLRNLLILICQILILALCAFLLAQPIIAEETENTSNEKVIILDASASMQASVYGETRFERAVNGITEYAEDVYSENADGRITLILAGTEAKSMVERVGVEDQTEFFAAVDSLTENGSVCTYGAADIEGAMVLADAITASNPLAEIVFFTGKKYLNAGNVTVMDVSDGEEWNVAVLDARAVVEEGFYTFAVDVACYGMDKEVALNCSVNMGPNRDPIEFVQNVDLSGDITRTVEFKTGAEKDVTKRVFEYESVLFSIVEDDSFKDDNDFALYGGIKPTLRVQYCSSAPNTFFSAALMSTANALRNRWDIEIDEVRPGGVNSTPQYSGYDFYIFENYEIPVIPTDGVVFMVNPTKLLGDFGIVLGDVMTGSNIKLEAGNPHPLTNYIEIPNLSVSRYTVVTKYENSEYTPVIMCAGVPVLLSKKTADQKIAVMTFSVNYSDIAMMWDFSTLVYNMFEYYLPSTFSKYIYDVNDTVTLNARGTALKVVNGGGLNLEINTFPTELVLTRLGVYTVTQTLLYGNDTREITESFYVKIPSEESNIVRVFDVLTESTVKTELGLSFNDLLVYFAAVLVALLLLEWWLQSRTSI